MALDILFQADITDHDPAEVLGEWREAGRALAPFTEELVHRVSEHEPQIDLMLEEHAHGWTVARMAAVDRSILRIAVEELLHGEDMPPSVAISEAVEAAAELSSDESRTFVNGVLGSIAREIAPTGETGA